MTFQSNYSRSHRGRLTATALAAVCCLAGPLLAQQPPTATQPATQPAGLTVTISEPENKHIERQAEVALARVAATLDASPPVINAVSNERALALNLLDAVLHEPAAPGRAAVANFRMARTQAAIDDMRRTRVTDDGMVVWQIYNMGYVVRTKSVTIGFDLVKMTHLPPFTLDDATTRAIADQCDVLLVTHEHLDHADREVSQMFLNAGKPVLAPAAMWAGEPIHDRLTHLDRNAGPAGHTVNVRGGTVPLNVVISPGFQQVRDGPDVENNVYVVTTPEGLRIGHTGDNNIIAGLPTVGTLAPVDVLFMKLIPDKLKAKEILDPFKPRLIVPSHLEEIGHERLNAREPYWRAIERVSKIKTPSVVMTWGERFRYARPSK